uniref:Uncharacterized protein n=1 Tax=Arundo donax TaxID=35708 RepID=A0A0A9AYY0_ARUDO
MFVGRILITIARIRHLLPLELIRIDEHRRTRKRDPMKLTQTLELVEYIPHEIIMVGCAVVAIVETQEQKH